MFFVSRSSSPVILVFMFWSLRCHGFSATAGRRLKVVSIAKRSPSLLFSTSDESANAPRDELPTSKFQKIDESSSSSSKEQHLVQWTTDEGTVEFKVYDGELLRTAALRRGVVTPHNGKSKLINCRGLGTCGTCAVEIAANGGTVKPNERNARERLRLSFPPHNPDKQSPLLRLACQIQVHGDLQVTKRSGFWGQYDDLSPSSEHQTYFGDLEFVLDNKSPEDK
jgi:ferredoxin